MEGLTLRKDIRSIIIGEPQIGSTEKYFICAKITNLLLLKKLYDRGVDINGLNYEPETNYEYNDNRPFFIRLMERFFGNESVEPEDETTKAGYTVQVMYIKGELLDKYHSLLVKLPDKNKVKTESKKSVQELLSKSRDFFSELTFLKDGRLKCTWDDDWFSDEIDDDVMFFLDLRETILKCCETLEKEVKKHGRRNRNTHTKTTAKHGIGRVLRGADKKNQKPRNGQRNKAVA